MARLAATCKMLAMAPDQAVVTPTLAPELRRDTDLSREVRAEQLALLCRQWLRVPVPVLFVAVVIGYVAWDYVAHSLVLVWGLLSVGTLLARMHFCRVLLKDGGASRNPDGWSRLLVGMAAINGVISGAASPLMLPSLPHVEQALLTMVMGCWGAGAVAANASYPASFYAFAWPFFALLTASWAFSGQPAMVWVMLLLLIFAVTLSVFVRENGRLVIDSIKLRFANDQLLVQKEQLIGLLRAEFDKAEGARAKAEEANRSKSQFLASASHDLRQPLHALSLLTALLNDMAQDQRVREVGQHIGQSVQSLERLFGALLDLSKLDAGVVKPELREIDLGEFVAQLSNEYRSKAQEKGLRFEVACEPMWVRGDPILLERIVRNLLENAIRFTHAGRVSLQVHGELKDVLLTVSDTGPGIQKAEQARVFEEFYQTENPGRERSKGLGLGLSIVRRLVDLLGYRIQLDSVEGHGASFTVILPGALVQRPAFSSVEAPAPAADVSGLTVLVIEDDAEARRAMQMTLKRWGCEALVVANAEGACELLSARGGAPDVLLSDYRLAHGADGIHAIQSLRARFGPIPAALLTGDISGDRLLELKASGLRVLHKPVKAPALRDLLHALARRDRTN
jgi:two-component system, sensor histidine kinase